jgi:hypothetical protein
MELNNYSVVIKNKTNILYIVGAIKYSINISYLLLSAVVSAGG